MDDNQTDRRKRALSIFDEVVELDGDARHRRIDVLCGDDHDLRAQVQALLDADAGATEPVSGDAQAWRDLLADATPMPEGDATGRIVGAWRITGILGRGGMGAVYAAERADGAYAQRAALKLIRAGVDSASARERFVRERQTLARLQHPHVAALFDGGFTGEGDPYFVMERVDGVAIDHWCDARKLGLGGRVDLFLQVLDAVQYAHRNLVVHRDLKPSNLLVSNDGQVKLLDFGIAKELQGGDLTATHDRALTFEYASPEQLHDAPITTATDIWQLGIVLHRLLSGAHPFGLGRDTPLAKQLQMLEREPESLTRAAAQAAPEVAALRDHDPASLAKALRGDLSNIVQGCLRRAPEQRYPSVEALAEDLRRWREHRPLRIAPPGRLDAARLWLRRHRLTATATAAVLVAVLGGTGVALWQAREAREQAANAGREAANAERAADNARAALSVLTETLAGMNPNETLDTRVSVRQLLEHAQQKLDARDTDPGVRQPVQRMLATLYGMRGDLGKALELYEKGLSGVEPRSRDEALALADDLANYSAVLGAFERGEESFAAAQRAAALRERYAADDPKQQVMAAAELAYASFRKGDKAAAERHWRRGIALVGSMPDPPMDDALRMYNQLSIMLSLDGRPALALPLAEEGIAFADRHGVPADSPVRSNLLRALSDAQAETGDAVGAERSIREAIALGEKYDGPDSPALGKLYNSLGLVLGDLGRYREATAALLRSDELQKAHASQVEGATRRNNIAGAYENEGDYARALTLYAEALAGLDTADGDVSDLRRKLQVRQARAIGLAGDPADAFRRLEALRAQLRDTGGGATIEYAFASMLQAGMARLAGDPARGMVLLDEAEPLWKAQVPATHPAFVQMQRLRADFIRQGGDPAGAARALEEALRQLQQATSANRFTEATLRADLAAIRLAQGDVAGARRLLDQALPAMRDAVLAEQVDRANAEVLARKLGV